MSITVLDVNGNDPVFTQPVYELRLNEDAAVGSSVLTLRASSTGRQQRDHLPADRGTHVTGFCAEQPERRGLITLALPLDYKQERQYVLAAHRVRRHAPHTAQVFINATDANTHRPVFQSSHYTVSISEDRPVRHLHRHHQRHRRGHRRERTHHLRAGGSGASVPHRPRDTGTIYTMTELDYEDQAAYTLAITARDNGIPQKSDTTSLEILILDANDNAPRLRDHQGSVSSRTRPVHQRPSRLLPPIGTQAPMAACCTPSGWG